MRKEAQLLEQEQEEDTDKHRSFAMIEDNFELDKCFLGRERRR